MGLAESAGRPQSDKETLMRRPLIIFALAGSLVGVGCGDEGSTSAKGDVKGYCEVTRSC